MIINNDFKLAIKILHQVIHPNSSPSLVEHFSDEYNGRGAIITALKIIHKVNQEGTEDQKNELLQHRREIKELNSLLTNNGIAERLDQAFGSCDPAEVAQLKNMQIAVPQTKFEKMVEIATLIPRVALAVITDIGLLPLAGVLLLYMLTKPSFDPVKPKQDKIPILLLHGSGFNESEWILGRQFLKKEQYGSIFSLNYAGLASNDPNSGIDDYAMGKVRDKILEIQKQVGQNRLIIIGHSMGGLIAGEYARRYAKQDGIEIQHVISIGSPWQGSPAVDRFKTGKTTPKRYQQMSSNNQFRKELVAESLKAERNGTRKYYSIGSKTDPAVSSSTSILTEDPRRQRLFSYMGHYSLIVSPRVWCQIRNWLDEIYSEQ